MARSARALTEQHRTHGRIVNVHLTRLIDPQMHAALHRRPGAHPVQPTLKMRKLGQIAAAALRVPHPTDAGHVGD